MAATEGNDTLDGTAGNDIIDGLGGHDVIFGGLGLDKLSGGAGDDRFDVRSAADLVAGETYAGGDGTNWISVTSLTADFSRATLSGMNQLIAWDAASSVRLTTDQIAGIDLIRAGELVIAGTGFVRVDAQVSKLRLATSGIDLHVSDDISYNFYIQGSAGADTMTSHSARAMFKGNGGNDVLNGAFEADLLWGGTGADTLSGNWGDDEFIVGAGENVAGDRYDGGDGFDYIRLQADTTLSLAQLENIEAVTGTAALTIGARDLAGLEFVATRSITINRAGVADLTQTDVATKTINLAVEGVTLLFTEPWGAVVDYVINGSAGSDRITAGFGRDTINAGGGNDFLDGGYEGRDTLNGGAGDDSYRLYVSDIIVEAADGGYDVVLTKLASVTLAANVEKLVFEGVTSFKATGNEIDNLIMGRANHDELSGGGGADILHGGKGMDALTGGAGADRFVFETTLSGTRNVDRVTDFAAEDFIVLGRNVFTAAGALSRLAADAFTVGTAAADAEDRLVYDQATGKLFYDPDGNGAGAQILFAQLNAGTELSAADFQIVG